MCCKLLLPNLASQTGLSVFYVHFIFILFYVHARIIRGAEQSTLVRPFTEVCTLHAILHI